MNTFQTEFTRKTPDGYRKWSGGLIYANNIDEANLILHKTIEPFLEDKLGDEVSELIVSGHYVESIDDNGLADSSQDEATKCLDSLDYWFYVPQIDLMHRIGELDEQLVRDMVSYFVQRHEYEICDKLNEIRRTIE